MTDRDAGELISDAEVAGGVAAASAVSAAVVSTARTAASKSPSAGR